jgi:hypothetical protein
MSAFSTAYRGGNSFIGLEAPINDSIKSGNNPLDCSTHDEVKAAFANLKAAVGGVKGAVDKFADMCGGIVKAADANNGKIKNVNDIARQVLEDELKELEASGGDKARIKELRDILKLK